LYRIFTLILLISSVFIFDPVHAQIDSSNNIPFRPNSKLGKVPRTSKHDTSQIDLVDVFNDVTKRGPSKKDSLAKPAKYHVSVVPAIGYTLSSGWAGIIAANVGFYTSNPQNTNISSITPSFIYSQYNQITVSLQANIWTRENRYNYVTDFRYYKYPQNTYGLGGHSTVDDADLLDYSHLRIHQSVLKNVLPNFYVGVGYFLDWHWNIKEYGQANGDSSDAEKYGLAPKSVSSGPAINLLYDNRKNLINPDGGLYADIVYRPNFTFMGSDQNWQSLTIDIRKYIRIPARSNNVLAIWSYDWLTPSGNPPYLDLPSTGWDQYNNTGRGYIQGRFRGLNMLYLEAEYRFGITHNGLLGAVVFANAESFSNYPSNNFDAIWPAGGIGLRIRVNKHSKANIALDYGWGADGSHGLFVNIGEVF